MNLEVRDLIERFQLRPHPEGGYFVETYRSTRVVRPDDERPERAAVTTIFYLLAAGQHSRWHRVRSDEIWHFHGGAPLELHIASESLDTSERVLLSDLDGAGRLVHAVPAMQWQAARTTGAYSLTGCTVAPGFEFTDFSFLRDDVRLREAILHLSPEQQSLI